MLINEGVPTYLGEVNLAVVICDRCGIKQAREEAYIPNPGWLHVTVKAAGATGRKEEHFCSIDCLVTNLVPDIYSTDPAAVQNAIDALKASIEEMRARGVK